MDTKKQKSIETINERIEAFEKYVVLPVDTDYINNLFNGRSPQYNVRFAAWARNTLDKDSHMENFINALLAKFSTDLLLGQSEYTDDFLRGQASGIIFLYEEMKRLSDVNTVTSDKKKKKN